MEYDVLINRDEPVSFFADIDSNCAADFVATYVEEAPLSWSWRQYMEQQYSLVYRCFYPLLRVSAAAIDCLFENRLEASRLAVQDSRDASFQRWPNDEVFTATILANHGFSLADFNQFGAHYTAQSFGFGTLSHPVQRHLKNETLYHPVRSGLHYLHAALKFNTFDISLLPALIDEANSQGKLREAVELSMQISLATLEDDPDQLLSVNSPIGLLLIGTLFGRYASTDIFPPLVNALGKTRKYQCLQRLREIADSNEWPTPDQLKNIALGKPALQSSICRWSRFEDCRLDAEGGNNGDLSVGYSFHTDLEQNPWWTVDLTAIYALSRLVIYNRKDLSKRLQCFEVMLSVDEGSWQTIYQSPEQVDPGPIISIALTDQPAGRFIRVQLPHKGMLHLVEFEAYGTKLPAF
jgi:hypothetical protein